MTTNQTIDGVLVPRELLELAMLVLVDNFSWAGELRALLDAKPDGSLTDEGTMPADQPQGEPVEYQSRTRPLWRAEDGERAWFPWEKCSAESFANYRKNPLIHEWQYEVRALYAEQPAPVAVLLAEAREWIGDGKHSDGLDREHWTPEYAALIDRIDAVLGAKSR